MGNGVAIELICMTNGHELRGRIVGGSGGGAGRREQKGKIGTTVIA